MPTIWSMASLKVGLLGCIANFEIWPPSTETKEKLMVFRQNLYKQ